jgi:hypothetical protein
MVGERRLALLVVLVAAGLGAGCGDATHRRDGEVVHRSRACVPADLRRGAPPAWARLPGVPTSVPYAVATGGRVAAFFFTRPLRAGRRGKLLWVVPRPGQTRAMTVRAGRMPRAGAPVVVVRADAGAGSGEIQRTILRLPAPGCWRVEVRSGSRRATLDVRVRP